ncbi:MAG: outer membrane beta-barrel protein [Deltaproteobacteria bacterium]|nr:outer membrane beta-barrel protein [Deltaproteobacteria bacterium]
MKKWILFFLLCAQNSAWAQYYQGGHAITKHLKAGAFVDGYYAYDFDNPPGGSVPYLTTPARDGFNVNLAYADLNLESDFVRGRLAVQGGRAVNRNYSAEENTNVRFLQESYVGFQPLKDFWIDTGIYFSPYGMESFISRNDWTYTRSMPCDFSPYYQLGVRMSYKISDPWLVQLNVMNGWQRITPLDHSKSVGMSVAYTPSDVFSLNYNNFIGKESGEMRFFNDVYAKYNLTSTWQVAAQYDFGQQAKPNVDGFSFWHGGHVQLRHAFSKVISMTGRMEFYWDADQVIVATNTSDGFKTWGGSVNVDVQLWKGFLWRTEMRGFHAQNPIYTNNTGTLVKPDGFVVSSLSLTL